MPVYNRFNVAFEKGVGAYLYDFDGKKYLDFGSGIAVSIVGHSHPHLVKTLKEQGSKLWHTSNIFRIPDQEKMAERLVDATFADNVFFTNSGVEAIECSIKLARKYQSSIGNEKRYRIITFNNAFHGRSMAAIAASGKEKMVAGFGPMPDWFDVVPFIDLDAVRAAITDETAGIMIEPVQGEGGILPATPEELQALRQIADEFGLVLIFDEIQCGMGRSGARGADPRGPCPRAARSAPPGRPAARFAHHPGGRRRAARARERRGGLRAARRQRRAGERTDSSNAALRALGAAGLPSTPACCTAPAGGQGTPVLSYHEAGGRINSFV